MKTSLDHLPEPKQAQLRDIVAIFREGAPIEMLILFGSHARGDWVEDPETKYRSDYDLLAKKGGGKAKPKPFSWCSRRGESRYLQISSSASRRVPIPRCYRDGWSAP